MSDEVENLSELQSETSVEYLECTKEAIHYINKMISDENLFWDYEGIDFVLNKLNLTFNDLRTMNEDTCVRNVKSIIAAGLPDHNETKAYKLMNDLRENYGIHALVQNKVLVEVLKKKHFFMDIVAMKTMDNLAKCELQNEQTYLALVGDVLQTLEEKGILAEIINNCKT